MPIDNACFYCNFRVGLSHLKLVYSFTGEKAINLGRLYAYNHFIKAGLRPDFAYEFSQM